MAHILVIEDEPLVREMFTQALSKQGHSVETASTGERGLELFRERSPDLVIADIRLPGISGLEVIVEIRCSSHPDVPVIATAGIIGMSEFAHDYGANCFLQKPFHVSELNDLVGRYTKPIRGEA